MLASRFADADVAAEASPGKRRLSRNSARLGSYGLIRSEDGQVADSDTRPLSSGTDISNSVIKETDETPEEAVHGAVDQTAQEQMPLMSHAENYSIPERLHEPVPPQSEGSALRERLREPSTVADLLSSPVKQPSRASGSHEEPTRAQTPTTPPSIPEAGEESSKMEPNVEPAVNQVVVPPVSHSPTIPRQSRAIPAKRLRNGKLCILRFPNDVKKFYHGSLAPLSPEEVLSRLTHFEQDGYNIEGFTLSEAGEGKSSYSAADFDTSERVPAVSIPDQKAWDDYVNLVTEERLRSLGVTPGPEAAQLAYKQTTSPFQNLAFSPPPPGSSAASQHGWQQPFSAPFSPASSTANTSVGAIQSPPPGLRSGPLVESGPAMHAQLAHESLKSPFWGVPPDSTSSNPKTPGSGSEAQAPSTPTGRIAHEEVESPRPKSNVENVTRNLEREAELVQYYPGEYDRRQSAERPIGRGLLPLRNANPARHASAPIQFNVDAKEFKFNPSGIQGQSAKPAKPGDATSSVSLATAHSRQGSVSLTNFNVAAPEFKPPASKNFAFTSSWFNFSKKPEQGLADDPTNTPSLAPGNRIFGNLADIVKPSESSKAVPIVAPDKDTASDEEDESGRIGQSSSRKKKGRFDVSDANDVPVFAEPTPEPSRDVTPQPPTLKEISHAPISAKTEDEQGTASLVDETNDLSDGVPWHGVEGDKDLDVQEDKQGTIPMILATSPATGPEDSNPPVAKELPATPKLDNNPVDFYFGEVPEMTPPAAQVEEPLSTRVEPPTVRRELQEMGQTYFPLMPEIEESPSVQARDIAFRASVSPMRRRDESQLPVVSDWDDMLSSGAEFKLPQLRAGPANDAHVVGLVEGMLRRHLAPFEKLIKELSSNTEKSAALPSLRDTRPVSFYEKSNSDADDEDDASDHDRRRREDRNERRMSQIRAAVKEAMTAAQAGGPGQIDQEVKFRQAAENRADDLQRLLALSEKEIDLYKESVTKSDSRVRMLELESAEASAKIRQVEEELRTKTLNFTAEVASLESALDESRASNSGMREEIVSAVTAREALQSVVEQLRVEASEIGQTRDSLRTQLEEAQAESSSRTGQVQTEHESALRRLQDEFQLKLSDTEQAHEIQAKKTQLQHETILRALQDEFKTKTINVEKTHEMQAKQTQSQHESTVRGLQDELKLRLKEAERTFETQTRKTQLQHETMIKEMQTELQSRLRDAERATQAQHTKSQSEHEKRLRKIQDELAVVSTRLAEERADSQNRDENHDHVLTSMRKKLEESTRDRQKLNAEVDRLAEKEKEAIRNQVKLEEFERARLELEKHVKRLSDKAIEHQTIVARYERIASEAHENTALEVQRTKALLQTDVEISKRRVENVRADLETRLDMAHRQLQSVRKDHDSVRDRYERSLNDAIATRKDAINEVNKLHATRLEDERKRFDESLRELSGQHDRSVRNAHEDRDRAVNHLTAQLKLSEAQVTHMSEKVEHLEERLSVAKSAAQAAVLAAKSAGVATDQNAVRSVPIPSHLEKVSPQALRESIVVLQEQLQEREGRIERLETSSIGPESEVAQRLKEREAEVTWLRELLNVRVDDLSDLVSSLDADKFDRGAARNAAIRIKANLQMEQHERDTQGEQSKSAASLLSLADVQSFATPRAAQIAAAWGNWRRNPPSYAAVREQMNKANARPALAPRPVNVASGAAPGTNPNKTSDESTFSPTNPMAAAMTANAGRQPDAQSFLSGLMTPPTSNLRRTPSTAAVGSSVPHTARPVTPSRTQSRLGTRESGESSLSASPDKGRDALLSNSPLLHKGDYDLDAELDHQDLDFEEEEDEGDAPALPPQERPRSSGQSWPTSPTKRQHQQPA